MSGETLGCQSSVDVLRAALWPVSRPGHALAL